MPGGRPPKPEDQKLISKHLKLPPDLARALKVRAKRDAIPETQVIVTALRQHLAAEPATPPVP